MKFNLEKLMIKNEEHQLKPISRKCYAATSARTCSVGSVDQGFQLPPDAATSSTIKGTVCPSGTFDLTGSYGSLVRQRVVGCVIQS